jgi:hypothetical protein
MPAQQLIADDAPHLAEPFLERVRHSYRLSLEGRAVSRGHIWESIDNLRAPVHAALVAPTTDGLREIFSNPHRSDLTYGFDRMARTLLSSMTTAEAFAEAERVEAERCRDQIILLAAALGLRRWTPPDSEQGRHGYPPDHDLSPNVEDLLSAISSEVGFAINFPNPAPGELGLRTARGVAGFRAIQAVYQAHRLVTELRGSPGSRILEIGPGAGRTASYARQAGLADYATVDLPLGVVAQAWFLGATLGPQAIWMIGDDPKDVPGRIRLLPSTRPLPDEECFDLALNVDSLTEMDHGSAVRYLEYVAGHARIFLSINHEANAFTLAQLRRSLGGRPGYRRSPYFMRNGYVEEVLHFPM